MFLSNPWTNSPPYDAAFTYSADLIKLENGLFLSKLGLESRARPVSSAYYLQVRGRSLEQPPIRQWKEAWETNRRKS